jgi:dolichol-phosphate mannosyltransferase
MRENYLSDKAQLFAIGRVALIALAILLLDVALFRLLFAQPNWLPSAHLAGAQMASFMAAAGCGSLLAVFGRGKKISLSPLCQKSLISRFLSWLILAFLILFLRGGLLANLMQMASLPPLTAQMLSAGFSAFALSGALYVAFYAPRTGFLAPERLTDTAFLLMAGYAVLLRLFYLGAPELLFEEAYYWNYAQHLDIGYLDHPLMVAWLIKVATLWLGNIEFAVRLGAFMCWFITACFIFRLTRDVFNRAVAYRALALIAVLPAYFSFGFFMSPDAPMSACWAAGVYFFYQIVVHDKKNAWLGLGIALGLGLISKYTISLLGVAIVLFLLIDKPSRRWFTRPEPYLALVLALLLFSPVVIWNFLHDWASFTFQSQGRLSSEFSFSLPRFIGNVIIFLTPTGLVTCCAILFSHKQLLADMSAIKHDAHQAAQVAGHVAERQPLRDYFLLTWLTFFPVAVFAGLSLIRASKLNWTGPCWLAIVPLMALLLMPKSEAGKRPGNPQSKLLAWCRRAWMLTLIICLLFYGALFQWLSLGFPGAHYPQNMHLIGWRSLGAELEKLVTELAQARGEKLLVVGMDRNKIASGAAFYRTYSIESGKLDRRHQPSQETASEHLFAGVGLMYEFWFPLAAQHGKSMLLISDKPEHLQTTTVSERVKTAGDIHELVVQKNGQVSGRYYYRVVSGYQEKSTLGAGQYE